MGIRQCVIDPRCIGQGHARCAPIPIAFFSETLRVGRHNGDALDVQNSQRLPNRLGRSDYWNTSGCGGGQFILARRRDPIARACAAVAEGGEVERAELR